MSAAIIPSPGCATRPDGLSPDTTRGLAYSAREALGEYLASYPWSFWFSATGSNKYRYPGQALRVARNAVLGVDRGFIGAERHYLGGWHTHGIFFTSVDLGAKESIRRLVDSDLSKSGFCRVESARSSEAVCSYISKYVAKGEDGEWMIFGGRYAWDPRWRI